MKKLLLILLAFAIEMAGHAQSVPEVKYDQKVENLASFARLCGYVQYFYPGDEATKLDWTKFKIYAIPKVEKAKNQDELKSVLDSLFSIVAPALKIYDENNVKPFDKKALIPANVKESDLKEISWQHLGLGSGKSVYKDYIIGKESEKPEKGMFGNLMACLPSYKYYNKHFKFKVAVKVECRDENSSGHLWFRVDKKDRATGFFDNMNNRPIKENTWKHYEITGVIDSNSYNMCFGMMLWGTGKMWVDDASISIQEENGKWVEVKDLNGDFEDKEKKLPSPWFQPSGVKGYFDKVTSETAMTGKQSILITNGANPLFDEKNNIGDYIQKNIGNHLVCIMPLALYGDDEHTYPRPDKKSFYYLNGILNDEISSNYKTRDRNVMLADAITLWNIYQHFYPYFDRVKVDWQHELGELIKDIYADENGKDLGYTLLKYITKTNDGHGNITSESSINKQHFSLPFKWEWIENRLVITEIFDSIPNLHIGDVVLKVNGTNAQEYMEKRLKLVPGATMGYKYWRACAINESRDTLKKWQIFTENASGKNNVVKLKRNSAEKENYGANLLTYKVIDKDIYYLNLNNITTESLDSLLPVLEKSRAIICDMRGYPKSDITFISHLLSEKDTCKTWMRIPKIIKPDHEFTGYKYSDWLLKPELPHIKAKIIYITDGRAISYAESYTGMIQGYKLATIIGEPTAGTNGNINTISLAGGYDFVFTSMKVTKLDGSPLFGVGFIPDIPLQRTIKGVREGRDEFLEKAIELARKQE